MLPKHFVAISSMFLGSSLAQSNQANPPPETDAVMVPEAPTATPSSSASTTATQITTHTINVGAVSKPM